MIAPLLVLALAAAAQEEPLVQAELALAEAGTCYHVDRLVEVKGADEDESEYRPYDRRKTPLSLELLARTWGFYSEWRHYPVCVENLLFKDLELRRAALAATVRLERNPIPLRLGEWDLIWERRVTLRLGKPELFHSRVADKDYRVVVTFGLEPDPAFCAPTPR